MPGPSLFIRQQCPIATPANDGLMSAAQAAAVAGGGSTATLADVYTNGAAAADQTMLVASANGGPVIIKGSSANIGALLEILSSVGATIFSAVDAATPKVLLPGFFVQNAPSFGGPVTGNQTVDGQGVSYTADGNGPEFGGTGFTCTQDSVTPADSIVYLTINDVPLYFVRSTGLFPQTPVALGNAGNPWGNATSNFYASAVTTPAIASNTITPTSGICEVGAGLIKTIALPYAGFIGTITLLPTAAFTYDNTGNILVASGSGTAVANRPMLATYNGTAWLMSY
jgi:hypothetical protein